MPPPLAGAEAEAGVQDAGGVNLEQCTHALRFQEFLVPTDIYSAPTIVAQDLNGDDSIDLAVVDGYNHVLHVFINSGDVGQYSEREYPVGAARAIAGDITGDGLPDLVLQTADLAGIGIMINRGDGTFEEEVQYLTSSSIGMSLSDFDGDGHLDITLVDEILHNRGNGTFGSGQPFLAEHSTATAVAAGDLTGDGIPDIVLGGYGPLQVLPNDGAGNVVASTAYPATYSVLAWLALTDLDGDGNTDVAIANYDSTAGSVDLWFNDGSGALMLSRGYATGGMPHSLSAADFNGDGAIDLAVAFTSGNAAGILMNQGNREFNVFVPIPGEFSTGSLVATDLNGDQMPDLVIAPTGGTGLRILINRACPSSVSSTDAEPATTVAPDSGIPSATLSAEPVPTEPSGSIEPTSSMDGPDATPDL